MYHDRQELTELINPQIPSNSPNDIFSADWGKHWRAIISGGNHPSFTVVDGVLFSSDLQTLVYCPPEEKGHYEIPAGTKIIGPGAFFFSGKTSVTIPDSVTFIADKAFFWSKLKTIIIPGSVKKIDKEAFMYCSNLTSLTICDGVTDVGYRAFLQCHNLVEVCIPDSVNTIGNMVFDCCNPHLVISVHKNSFAMEYCMQEGLKYKFMEEETVYPIWPEELSPDTVKMRFRYLATYMKAFEDKYSCGDYTSHIRFGMMIEPPDLEDLDYKVENLTSAVQSFARNVEINADEKEREALRNELKAEIITALEATKAALFTLSPAGKDLYHNPDTTECYLIYTAGLWYSLELAYYD